MYFSLLFAKGFVDGDVCLSVMPIKNIIDILFTNLKCKNYNKIRYATHSFLLKEKNHNSVFHATDRFH